MHRPRSACRDERFSSAHWTRLDRPVVASSEEGASRLGRLYFSEVQRITGGLVRPRERTGNVSLTLAGLVDLITFGSAVPRTGRQCTECRFPIEGGLLVAYSSGSLAIVQREGGSPELGLVVTDYAPRLARRSLSRRALYDNVQARLHVAISRRFLARMRSTVDELRSASASRRTG